jgi:hypothetical protein
MTKILARHCDQCKQYGEIELHAGNFTCPNCSAAWGKLTNIDDIFKSCPICTCSQFYLAKQFNQFVGCAIMAVGIVLVPFTFGLSLPVFALVDWLLHKRVPTTINCYRCGTEFRGFENKNQFKPFIHQIGLRYDKYRK